MAFTKEFSCLMVIPTLSKSTKAKNLALFYQVWLKIKAGSKK